MQANPPLFWVTTNLWPKCQFQKWKHLDVFQPLNYFHSIWEDSITPCFNYQKVKNPTSKYTVMISLAVGASDLPPPTPDSANQWNSREEPVPCGFYHCTPRVHTLVPSLFKSEFLSFHFKINFSSSSYNLIQLKHNLISGIQKVPNLIWIFQAQSKAWKQSAR